MRPALFQVLCEIKEKTGTANLSFFVCLNLTDDQFTIHISLCISMSFLQLGDI